ncbi:histidine kinase [Streptomyces sp. NPDC091272]|uniref:histidine kinase n=1 Tax=Streptomyces sp. NPDC091272 TaxID=3365981 RepID=UPI003814D04A
MPSFDMSRSRFRLADEHVIVLSELASGNVAPDEFAAARQELLDCGLITAEGKLSTLLLPLLRTVLTPGVVISLETASRQGKLHHGMLIGEEHVVAHEAWPGTAESEYTCVEPKTLVWKLAEMVNLQQSPGTEGPAQDPRDKAAAAVVETTLSTVEAGLAVLEGAQVARPAEVEHEAIHRALATTGALAEPSLTLLADLISELRSSWRLTSAWQTRTAAGEATEARGFAVWDCGPLGYWLRELPTEPVPDTRIAPSTPFRLVQVPAKTIWTHLTDLLPPQSDLRAAKTEQAAREA